MFFPAVDPHAKSTPCPTRILHRVRLELQPRIYQASTLRGSPALAEQIRQFANEGYKYMAEEIKPRWEYFYGDRLPTPQSLFDIVGEDGMFAVLYAREDGKECMATPVACAATKRWGGDLEGRKAAKPVDGEEGEEDKEGWEILCVTTHVEYMRRGYAQQCIEALITHLSTQYGHQDQHQIVERVGPEAEFQPLTIWTQAIEELNGRFWRNRGWSEVRRYNKPVGSWGSKFGYELLVLVREVEVRNANGGDRRVRGVENLIQGVAGERDRVR